jgi:hypothetical protein
MQRPQRLLCLFVSFAVLFGANPALAETLDDLKRLVDDTAQRGLEGTPDQLIARLNSIGLMDGSTLAGYLRLQMAETSNERIAGNYRILLDCVADGRCTGLSALRGDGQQKGGSANGEWSTTYGIMTLTQSGSAVEGTYTEDGGRVQGTISGSAFDGYWAENSSLRDCGTAMMGTNYWGRLVLSFSEASFTGQWSYCNEDVSSAWDGTRQ